MERVLERQDGGDVDGGAGLCYPALVVADRNGPHDAPPPRI